MMRLMLLVAFFFLFSFLTVAPSFAGGGSAGGGGGGDRPDIRSELLPDIFGSIDNGSSVEGDDDADQIDAVYLKRAREADPRFACYNRFRTMREAQRNCPANGIAAKIWGENAWTCNCGSMFNGN